jgi:hypothetical protein
MNGDSCPYLHPAVTQETCEITTHKVDDSRSQIPCRHFNRGDCRDGKACPYLHTKTIATNEIWTHDEVRISLPSAQNISADIVLT